MQVADILLTCFVYRFMKWCKNIIGLSGIRKFNKESLNPRDLYKKDVTHWSNANLDIKGLSERLIARTAEM